MTITAKTAAALLAIFLVLLGSMAFILNRAVLPGFSRLEMEAHGRDVARARANLDALARDIQTRVLDYAQWDDTYAFMGGRNRSFIAENFSDDWFANYDADLLAFYDDHGVLLWARQRNADGAVVADTATARQILLTSPDIRVGGEAVPTIVWTRDGPMLAAVAPATQNDGGGAPRGTVILGKRITKAALRDQTQIDVDLIASQAVPADLRAHFDALIHAPVLSWSTPDTMQALIALRDGRGRLVGALSAHRNRAIAAQGAQAVGVALALFAALAALATAALWIVLRQMVIARILRLERHFNAQSNAQDLQPLPISGARDELERLASAYNALAARVRDADERARRADLERESAKASNQMKSDFLANISHELRTPLNAVIGYTELVQEEMADHRAEWADKDLQRIGDAGRHLLSLVNEILDLSKIEAGRLEITPSAFPVKEVIDSATDAVRPLAQQNGNILSLDLPPDLGVAYLDEMRLRQCLINVLTNACKFTQGGHVVLQARRAEEGGQGVLRFVIRDTGIGMSSDKLARLFEPFVHADESVAHRHGGAGLGLAITRKIMSLLGGTIEANSVEGEGSVFVLTAPIIVEEAAVLPPARAAKAMVA